MNWNIQPPMRSVWRSLLWKEWHEHKWKLVVLCLLMLVSWIFFSYENPRMLTVNVSTTLFCYGILAGTFIGMSTAAGENGRGTMKYLQTMPVAMRGPALIKLLMSILTVTIPVLLLVGLAYISLVLPSRTQEFQEAVLEWSNRMGFFGLWHPETLINWFTIESFLGSAFVSSILLWMAACGVNRSDEIRAGAIGFLVCVGVWFGLALLANRAEWAGFGLFESFAFFMMAAAPGGTANLQDLSSESHFPWYALVLLVVVSHGFLLARYLKRFGTRTVRPVGTQEAKASVPKTDWVAPPRRSKLTAIVWKQLSETGPLAVLAAVAVLAISGCIFWFDPAQTKAHQFGTMLAAITFGVGYLVTVVAGMGVFLEDLKPQVGFFWRSRPVNRTLWFFVKYFTGLTVLIVTFGGLALLAFALQKDYRLLDSQHPGLQVAVMTLILLLIYTLSMVSYCLSRQPVIAALAALGVLFAGMFAFGYLVDRVVPLDLQQFVGFVVLIFAQLAATILAWLAVRNDWGWRH